MNLLKYLLTCTYNCTTGLNDVKYLQLSHDVLLLPATVAVAAGPHHPWPVYCPRGPVSPAGRLCQPALHQPTAQPPTGHDQVVVGERGADAGGSERDKKEGGADAGGSETDARRNKDAKGMLLHDDVHIFM